MKQLSALFISALALMFYASCNKNNDLQNPDPETIDSVDIMGFKDSTLLIKSIHSIGYNGDGSFNDSSTAYISYDTINKKITITDEGDSEIQEFTYNSKGLVERIRYAGDNDSSTTDYTYDESNILKSVTEKGEVSDDNSVYTLNKTLLPSGNYQLKWEEPLDPYNPDIHEYFLANFDSKGSTLSYYDYANNKLFISDSILYEAGGSISKAIRTLWKATQADPDATVTFTQFDFNNRDTKGDHLYNFYRILYNGISNFSDIYSGFGGPFEETFFQFFKYPALATDITNPDGDSFKTVRFNNTPQYDTKNRLIKFRTFFDDVELYVTEYTLSYYK